MNTFMLIAHVVWLAVLFGHRTWQHLRSTGDSGWRGLSGGTLGVSIKLLFVVAAVGFVIGTQSPLSSLWPLAALLYMIGFIIAVSGQAAMGRWWRIGVREGEAIGLVTAGPFRWVRNPIFTGMLVLLLGFVVAQPSVATVVGWVATLGALWLQVAQVEEPHLRKVLGEPYLRWAEHRGRFW